MYTFVWFSGAIWETPSKKTAVILSHLYVIGVKIVLCVISKLSKPHTCQDQMIQFTDIYCHFYHIILDTVNFFRHV